MKTIELDLTGCKTWYDLHERIRVAFGFPEECGKNWNAFWDMLSWECDAEHLIIKGEHTMPKDFADSLEMMHKLLDDLIALREEYKEYGAPPFSYEIVD